MHTGTKDMGTGIGVNKRDFVLVLGTKQSTNRIGGIQNRMHSELWKECSTSRTDIHDGTGEYRTGEALKYVADEGANRGSTNNMRVRRRGETNKPRCGSSGPL